MDRLKAMDAFVRAAERGSLSAAARDLHTTQPTVSKLVAALERSVGARLLERGSSRVVLTDEGLRFHASARRLLEEYGEAVAELEHRRREPQGLVRIAAPVALGELRVAPLVLQALKRFPQLEIELILEDRYVDVVEERFDLAVRIGDVLPQDLVAVRLAEWPRYLVASPAYVKRHGAPRKPEDLAEHEYLRYARAGGDDLVLTGPGRSITLPLRSRYRVNHAAALLDAVQRGVGVVLEPCWMVNPLLRQGKLVRLLPAWTGPSQIAHLVHAPRRRQPMRVQAMIDFMREAVAGW